MVWRIGYYVTGKIDVDFRIKNCKNYGPSRMWFEEGGMYLDEFFIKPGIKHGIHRRWYDNQTLAREAKYNMGNLLYEKEYKRNGKLKSEK